MALCSLCDGKEPPVALSKDELVTNGKRQAQACLLRIVSVMAEWSQVIKKYLKHIPSMVAFVSYSIDAAAHTSFATHCREKPVCCSTESHVSHFV